MDSRRWPSWSGRTRFATASVLALLALLACQRRAPGPALQIVGDSVKVRGGEPLPARSAIFDGERVRLRGVRGETLGVQVLLDGGTAAPTPVGLELDDGGGGGGVVAIEAFQVHEVAVTRPSTSMYGASRGGGRYPDRLEPTAQPVLAGRAAFFDVAIAADAPAGLVTGTLTIGARRVPVELRVEPLRIELRADPLVWVWYKPQEIARAHGVADRSAEQLAWEARYAALFRAHGAYASTDLDPDRLPGRDAFLDGVRYWPVYLPRESEAVFREHVRFWIDRLADSPAIPFAIPIDEPRQLGRQLAVKVLADWARREGAGGERFWFAVTDTPRLIYGDAIDVYLSMYAVVGRNRDRPPGAPQVWTYNGGIPWAGSMIIDTDGAALRTWGWIAFRYDLPLWHAWEGMYFSDRYNDKAVTEVETDPVTFDDGEDHGNGDGLLAYPGALPSLRLKSLRRGLQDRLMLQLLARCADGGQAAADTLAEQLVPRALGEMRKGEAATWPVDEEAWETARGAILDALLAAPGCRDGAAAAE
jgi:hypothetical protein